MLIGSALEHLSLQKTINELQVFPETIRRSALDFNPIQFQTVNAAQTFITRFFLLIVNDGQNWVSPHITTEGDGGISFEWWRKEKVLTIFVDPSGSIESLKTWGPNIWDEMEEIIRPF